MIDTIRNNKIIILLLFAVMVTGALLMLVSQEVYKTEHHVKKMERDKQILTWEIRSLNGELAYLTRPDRLDQLSTAMANASPQSHQDRSIIITPVQFSDMRTHHIIPPHKPRVPRQVNLSQIKTPDPQKTNDFSSLLNIIGGEN